MVAVFKYVVVVRNSRFAELQPQKIGVFRCELSDLSMILFVQCLGEVFWFAPDKQPYLLNEIIDDDGLASHIILAGKTEVTLPRSDLTKANIDSRILEFSGRPEIWGLYLGPGQASSVDGMPVAGVAPYIVALCRHTANECHGSHEFQGKKCA